MDDTDTGPKLFYGTCSNTLITKQVVDRQCLFVTELYGFKDFRKLHAFIALCHLRMRYITPDNPNPEIFLETKDLQNELDLSEWLLKSFKKDLETKCLIKRVRRHVWNDNSWHGSQTHIQITEKGLALFWRIMESSNSGRNRPLAASKRERFVYTEADTENAKFWFKSLRKYWRDYPGKLAMIGDWQEKWQPRSNGMRKARERVNMTEQEFREILETIVNSEDGTFFLKNVIAPDTFSKKWSNGLTVAENMVNRCDEIRKKREEQQALQLNKEDVPVYPDKDGNDVEDENVTNVWDSMWDIIGKHLKQKFRTEQDKDIYWQDLVKLCEELADRLHLRPGRIVLKDSRLRSQLADDPWPAESSYFYFLLDKYRGWNGLFSKQMLWDGWMEFWKRVLKLDHGIVTEQDLQQFAVQLQEGEQNVG